MRKIILALAMLVASSAHAEIARFLIEGTLSCGPGEADPGGNAYCSSGGTQYGEDGQWLGWEESYWDAFRDETGFSGEGLGIEGYFTMLLTVDTVANTARGYGTAGPKISFQVDAHLVDPDGAACDDNPGTQVHIDGYAVGGVPPPWYSATTLCLSSRVSNWAELVLMDETSGLPFSPRSWSVFGVDHLRLNGWDLTWRSESFVRVLSVPLPGTLALMGLGLLMVARRR